MKYSLRVISIFNTVPYGIISLKKKEKNKVKGLKDLENVASEKKGFEKIAKKSNYWYKNNNICNRRRGKIRKQSVGWFYSKNHLIIQNKK